MTLSDATWIDDVLRFWFHELKPKDWWSASPAADEAIRERFASLHERLVRDPPSHDVLDGRGHVAAVIVFDQLSRQLFRGSAAAFATDRTALALTLDAIDRGLDRDLSDMERQFLYMPLMHSEDPAMQRRSLVQFALLTDRRALRSATRHHDTIARFGRFPARNGALGRASTDAERTFLLRHRTSD